MRWLKIHRNGSLKKEKKKSQFQYQPKETDKSVLQKCFRKMGCPKSFASTFTLTYLTVKVNLICHEVLSLVFTKAPGIGTERRNMTKARTTRQREGKFCDVTCKSRCSVSRSSLSSIITNETYKALQWLSDILLTEAKKPTASLLNCGNRRLILYIGWDLGSENQLVCLS